MTQHVSPPQLTTVRPARRNDLAFVAWCNREATSPTPGFCYWDPLLEGTGTPTATFLEAAYALDALAWGKVEDFLLVEAGGVLLAGGSGFTMRETDYRPLDLGRLPEVAERLGWNADTLAAFRADYERVWSDRLDDTLAPQAPWILECIAVVPEARGRRLTVPLLSALLDEGRRRGHTTAGISVTTGNVPAQRAYERAGFGLYIAYGADYFGGAFPGTTKYRVHLDTQEETR